MMLFHGILNAGDQKNGMLVSLAQYRLGRHLYIIAVLLTNSSRLWLTITFYLPAPILILRTFSEKYQFRYQEYRSCMEYTTDEGCLRYLKDSNVFIIFV